MVSSVEAEVGVVEVVGMEEKGGEVEVEADVLVLPGVWKCT